MRDYSELVNAEINWKSNEELTAFDREYKPMIISLLRKKNVENASCFTLYNDILIKFGRGKLNYDKNVGKFETFLYTIAENAARDYFREHNRTSGRNVELSDHNTATLYDCSREHQEKFEHYRTIAVETLKRLYSGSRKNMKNIEIFARRCFVNDSVQLLADDYGKSKNEVSLIASRLHKKYKKIFAEVEEDMKNNTLIPSNVSIDFLEPIMDFSFAVA